VKQEGGIESVDRDRKKNFTVCSAAIRKFKHHTRKNDARVCVQCAVSSWLSVPAGRVCTSNLLCQLNATNCTTNLIFFSTHVSYFLFIFFCDYQEFANSARLAYSAEACVDGCWGMYEER
jgi:hypothetical protein